MANTELHRLASKSYIKIDNSAIEAASSQKTEQQLLCLSVWLIDWFFF